MYRWPSRSTVVCVIRSPEAACQVSAMWRSLPADAATTGAVGGGGGGRVVVTSMVAQYSQDDPNSVRLQPWTLNRYVRPGCRFPIRRDPFEPGGSTSTCTSGRPFSPHRTLKYP